MSWGPQGRGCCQPVTLPRPRVLHLPVLPRHLERRASGQSPFRGEGVQPPLARGAPEAGRQRGCSQFRQVPRVLLGQPRTVGAPRSARHCGCSRARQGRRGAGRGGGPSGRRRKKSSNRLQRVVPESSLACSLVSGCCRQTKGTPALLPAPCKACGWPSRPHLPPTKRLPLSVARGDVNTRGRTGRG